MVTSHPDIAPPPFCGACPARAATHRPWPGAPWQAWRPHAAVAPLPQPCHGHRARSGEPARVPGRTHRAAPGMRTRRHCGTI